jgi:hypothetical protein
VKGEKVYITHTFPDKRTAKGVAKTLARQYIAAETTVPLYLHHPLGNLWPEITASKASSNVLKNQLWTVAPVNRGTQFTNKGDNLRVGLSFPGRKIINNAKNGIWGFATPIIALHYVLPLELEKIHWAEILS